MGLRGVRLPCPGPRGPLHILEWCLAPSLLSPPRFYCDTTHRTRHYPEAHISAAPSTSTLWCCRPPARPQAASSSPTDPLPVTRSPPAPAPPHRRLPVSVGLSPAGPAHRWLARHSRFRVWSVSRGITSSRSTGVVASVGVHSFLRLSHSSPFTGHWGYFRLSAVANDAANICSLLFSFFRTPSSGIAGPHGDSTFSFLRSLRAVFHRRRSILHPRQPCTRAPISPHLFCFCF